MAGYSISLKPRARWIARDREWRVSVHGVHAQAPTIPLLVHRMKVARHNRTREEQRK